ncbi:T9SS type A sorting domain-containing protein [bacterium]|nr:T9SS type A sorting domain-containing protein [bacterium]
MNKIFWLFSIVVLVTCATKAEILFVPQDFDQIQEAIDAAQTGDTVVVSESAYQDTIMILNRSLTLSSEYILDRDTSHISNTWISPPHNALNQRVINVNGQLTDTVSIMGFTIANGFLREYITYGAGIRADTVFLHLEQNRFINNTADRGGAVAMIWCNSRIIDNVFEQNSYRWSGSLHADNHDLRYFTGKHFLSGNVFRNNHTELHTNGWAGAVDINGYRIGVTIEGCEFYNNQSDLNGGAVYLLSPLGTVGSYAIVNNCIFEGNISGLEGGGISTVYIDSVEVSNCYFENNITGDSVLCDGGALHSARTDINRYYKVDGNTFINNETTSNTGALSIGCASIVSNNVFINNGSREASALQTFANIGEHPGTTLINHNVFYGNYSFPPESELYAGVLSTFFDHPIDVYENDFLWNPGVTASVVFRADENTMDLRNNYWGAASGPYHAEFNPAGEGDTLATEDEIFTPFSTTPYTAPQEFHLRFPEDGWTGEEGIAQFNWTVAQDFTTMDAVQYKLQIAVDENFENVTEYNAGSDTTYTIEGWEFEQQYWWRVYAEDSFGLRTYSVETFSLYFTGVEEQNDRNLPHSLEIIECYPNPFNSVLNVTIGVPEAGTVSVRLIDLLGRQVTEQFISAVSGGLLHTSIDADRLPSAIYFLEVSQLTNISRSKVLLIK